MDFDEFIFHLEEDMHHSLLSPANQDYEEWLDDNAFECELYKSPTHSIDSGLDLNCNPSDDFLSVLSPVMNDVVMTMGNSNVADHVEDDNESILSGSVSSSLHDHSYVINSQKQSNLDLVSSEIFSKSEFSLKRKSISIDSDIQSPVVEKNLKVRKSSSLDSVHNLHNNENVKDSVSSDKGSLDIDIIECDDPEKFAYRDENGKMVVVDRSRKNAEMARLNRQRKKRYISNLENEVKSLRSRNDKLMILKSENQDRISTLENEVLYLKSVIKNETTLSSVLRAVSNSPDINFGNKNTDMKIVERLPGKRGPIELTNDDDNHTGGICLHVSSRKVSLEFCSICNRKQ